MSRGDEIEEGGKRRGWKDYNEGANEPDEPRDRDDRAAIARPRRSGAVTAVGIVAIILGCFVLLGSVCVSLQPVIMPALLDFAAKQNPNDPNLGKAREAMARIPTWYLLGLAAIDFFRAIGLLVGGIGVLKRSNLARVLTMMMAALGIVMFLVSLGGNFAFGAIDAGDPSSLAGGVFGIACNAVLNLGFAGMALVLLLSPKNAQEFRG